MFRDYLRQIYRMLLPLLYGRAQYKMFLKAGLGEVDLRAQQLASFADYYSSLIRPIRIQAPFGKSMLVVAPHQDDEVIGCGGVLALQARSGREASTVVLTDGGDAPEAFGMLRHELAEARNEESRRAASALGAGAPRFLGHDNLTEDAPRVVEELEHILLERKTDAVFVPFVLDGHPQHRQANYVTAEALKRIGGKVRVFGYEVWSFAIPNVAVVIDDVIELKLEALQRFALANQAVNYTWSTKGANMYRSRLLEVGVANYAECFFELPREEYIALVARVQAVEKRATP